MAKKSMAFKNEAEAKALMAEIKAVLEEAKRIENWEAGELNLEEGDIKIAEREIAEIQKIIDELERMASVTGKLFEQYKKIAEWESQPGSQAHVRQKLEEANNTIAAIQNELVKDESELAEIKELVEDMRKWDRKVEARTTAELKGDVKIDQLLKKVESVVDTISNQLKWSIAETRKLVA